MFADRSGSDKQYSNGGVTAQRERVSYAIRSSTSHTVSQIENSRSLEGLDVRCRAIYGNVIIRCGTILRQSTYREWRDQFW